MTLLVPELPDDGTPFRETALARIDTRPAPLQRPGIEERPDGTVVLTRDFGKAEGVVTALLLEVIVAVAIWGDGNRIAGITAASMVLCMLLVGNRVNMRVGGRDILTLEDDALVIRRRNWWRERTLRAPRAELAEVSVERYRNDAKAGHELRLELHDGAKISVGHGLDLLPQDLERLRRWLARRVTWRRP
jgi:hypothetical protein